MAVPKSRGSFCCWFIIGLRCFLGRPFCVTFAVPLKNCGDSEFDSLTIEHLGFSFKDNIHKHLDIFIFRSSSSSITSRYQRHNARYKIHVHRAQLPCRQHSNGRHTECNRNIQRGILIHVRASLIPTNWAQRHIGHIDAMKITWMKPKMKITIFQLNHIEVQHTGNIEMASGRRQTTIKFIINFHSNRIHNALGVNCFGHIVAFEPSWTRPKNNWKIIIPKLFQQNNSVNFISFVVPVDSGHFGCFDDEL